MLYSTAEAHARHWSYAKDKYDETDDAEERYKRHSKYARSVSKSTKGSQTRRTRLDRSLAEPVPVNLAHEMLRHLVGPCPCFDHDTHRRGAVILQAQPSIFMITALQKAQPLTTIHTRDMIHRQAIILPVLVTLSHSSSEQNNLRDLGRRATGNTEPYMGMGFNDRNLDRRCNNVWKVFSCLSNSVLFSCSLMSVPLFCCVNVRIIICQTPTSTAEPAASAPDSVPEDQDNIPDPFDFATQPQPHSQAPSRIQRCPLQNVHDEKHSQFH